ncbi:MAG: hypothetical protein ABSB80_00780 [Methanoregula sp.]|uniref:hypothetical protein n=1 Tax=Methanoregula sp. TaxID=2052170 RepID=UPI003D14F0F2
MGITILLLKKKETEQDTGGIISGATTIPSQHTRLIAHPSYLAATPYEIVYG